MATVYDFARRLADSQDWTPGERAQLRELGLQLGVVRSDLDIVFGRSDDGDPWCVVTDRSGDVLLHVARIAGCFIVHAATEDQIVEGRDLWSAAFQALGHALTDRRGVLLPFSADALTQNAILAFMLTAALRGELGRLPGLSTVLDALAEDRPPGETAHADPFAGAPESAAPASQASRTHAADLDAAHQSGRAPAGPEAPALPPNAQSETAAAAEAVALAQAQAQGGAGPGGAPSVQPVELVVGGKGEDRIPLGEHVAAIGGEGADTFVLPLPDGKSRGSALLGAVLDFHPGEGDRLTFAGGGRFTVTSDQPVADVRAERGGGPPVPSDVALAGRKIGYDTNGDHVEDGYVLVSNAAHDWVAQTFGPVVDTSAGAHAGAGSKLAASANTPAPPPLAFPGPDHSGF